MDAGGNPIMHLYYTSRPVLFGMCAGNELFYASLYLLNFTTGPFYIFNIVAFLCFPVAMAKLAIAVLQVATKNLLYTMVSVLHTHHCRDIWPGSISPGSTWPRGGQ